MNQSRWNYPILRVCVAVLCGLTTIAGPVRSQTAADAVRRAIKVAEVRHPYLLFSDDEIPRLKKQIASDRESGEIWAEILAQGHRFLYFPFKNPPPAHAKNPRFYTEQTEAARYSAELREGALKLAFLYRMTGDVAYGRKAAAFALAICDLPSWVNPAHHFDIIYPRVWPWNVPDDQVVFSYDITASGHAIDLSIVYDWLYPVLTKHEKDKIRGTLLDRAITKARGNYDLHWWSSAHRCNWSAICFSGLGVTSLALMKEHPEMLDVAAEAFDRIQKTFDQIGEDGGWQEGRGYYGYMMRETVLYMDALKRLTGGKFDLFSHPRVKVHPTDFWLFGLTANFEDSGGGPIGTTAIVNKLVTESGSANGAWYRNTFFGAGDHMYDILWPRSSVQPVEPEVKSKWFRSIDWAVLRSSFTDSSYFTIACKAGFNDDPHHGHLDIGQFNLTWHNTAFIRDIGRMRYDEQYFSEDRWLYPFASSDGHNLITVNGEQQIQAKLKNAPWKQGIGGKILRFETTATRDHVLMDPTNAYPGKELKKWRRSIVLEKPVAALILDEVGAQPGSSIRARFFPASGGSSTRTARDPRFPPGPDVNVEVKQNHILLHSQGKFMVFIPVVSGDGFAFSQGRLPAVAVVDGAVTEWVPYIDVVTTAKTRSSIVATVFVTARNAEEGERLAADVKMVQQANGDIEVTASDAERRYRWSFRKEKDGYALSPS